MNNQKLTMPFTTLHLTNTEYRCRGGYDQFDGVARFTLKTQIILHAEGKFQLSTTLQQSSTSKPQSNNKTIRKGTWSIHYNDEQSAFLVLTFNHEEQMQFSINYYKSHGIMLNGKRFSVEKNLEKGKENGCNSFSRECNLKTLLPTIYPKSGL